MKRIEIQIDPKDDGTILVVVNTLTETAKDGASGSYNVTKIEAPVPRVKE